MPQRVRLYPEVRPHRTILVDVVVILCLVAAAVLAIRVHDDVAGLKQLGSGVIQTGSSVEHGLSAVASAVSGTPIVGGELSSGLRSAGADTAGAAITATQKGENEVGRAATLLGWLVFLLPEVLVLGRYLPARARQIRRITAAATILHPRLSQQQRHLMAQRAGSKAVAGQSQPAVPVLAVGHRGQRRHELARDQTGLIG